MPSYAVPLSTALFIFAIIAFIGTIPWTIYQYRKFGHFSFWRNFIFFTFIYYCLTAFFLVSLPLPKNRNDVAFKNHIATQFHPLNFINDFKTVPGFEVNNIRTYPKIIKSFAFLQNVFNIALLFPLGIYLRFFFKKAKKWWIALLIIFSTTLFFEVSQLTALFGYYVYPYRLFDVDDLLMNTIGGMLGFFAAPMLLLFIPTRDQLHQKDSLYDKDRLASYGSQLLEVAITLFITQAVGSLIVILLFKGDYLFITRFLMSLVGFVVLPLATKGTTIGGKIIKLSLILPPTKRVWGLMYRFLIIYTPSLMSRLTEAVYKTDSQTPIIITIQLLTSLVSFLIWLTLVFIILKDWLKKKEFVFFNQLSRITFIRK